MKEKTLLLSIFLLIINHSSLNLGCRSHDHKIRLGNKKEQVERLDFPVNQPRELDPSQLPEDSNKRALLDEARCYEWKDSQVIIDF